MRRIEPITERAETAAIMVRRHGVTVAQAAACLRVPIVLVQIALGTSGGQRLTA